MKPKPDPIFAVTAEVERLEAECAAFQATCRASHDAVVKATDAVRAYVSGTLLKTVPVTAAGCKALAAFAPGLFERWAAIAESSQGTALFRLIARSPLL